MAGAGYKLFSTGDVLTATDVNTYLMQQTVMVFNDAAARTTALSGVVAEGMLSYLKDTNAVEVYDGANWVASDDPNAIQNSIVDAKGDLIAASADNTPARLAVGANGTTLVADSSTATGLAYIPTLFSGKNKIINGDFGVWQRGTSFTNLATNAFTADRWRVSSANTTIDVSRSTFTLGAAPLAGLDGKYFATVTADSTDTDARLNQPIEGVATFAGQTVTVSFYAKSTVTTDALRWVRIQQSFGTGGSPSSVVNTDSAAITLTGSWARYSVTLSVPSISGKTLGTDGNDFLGIGFGLKASTAQTLDIWGVQLEAGSSATAFQTATGTIQGELAACQRYYYRQSASGNANYMNMGIGYGDATTTARIQVNLPVTMRTYPTIIEYSTLRVWQSGVGQAITALTIDANFYSPHSPILVATVASGLTQGTFYLMGSNNSSAGYLGLGAEL